MENFGKKMMTLAGGMALLFVLACAPATVAAQPGTEAFRTLIGAPVAGDSILTGAYCSNVGIAFMKRFTAMLAEYGTKGYWNFIEQKNSPCYDTRMNRKSVKPVRATLVKRLWEFELHKGKTYVMWEVKDKHGGRAYSWTELEGQET